MHIVFHRFSLRNGACYVYKVLSRKKRAGRGYSLALKILQFSCGDQTLMQEKIASKTCVEYASLFTNSSVQER